MDRDATRAASSVIGVLLLVGVAVVVGGVVAVGALTFLDNTGAPTANADFTYERTPTGLRMTPQAIGTTVTVQLNGRDVATFTPDSAGQSVLLPTAPGDRLTVVSQDREKSVLVDRTVEGRSQVGDFIAYYTFDGESGDSELVDRSGNDNNGTLEGSPSWNGGSLGFDGSDDAVAVTDLNTPVSSVSEFTIAVSYRTDNGDKKQELVEHISGSDNWGMEIKSECPSCPPNSSTYNPNFFADEAGGSQDGQIFAGEQPVGERRVLVGTYDKSAGETRVYIDGARKATGSFDSEINMGDFYIGRDAEASNDDYLDGEIYEIRLYYTAFDDQEVKTVTAAMA